MENDPLSFAVTDGDAVVIEHPEVVKAIRHLLHVHYAAQELTDKLYPLGFWRQAKYKNQFVKLWSLINQREMNL